VLDVVPLSPVRAGDLWLRPTQAEAGPQTILYVGAVGKQKGLEYLIGACRLLAERGVEFRLRLVLQTPPTTEQQELLAPIRERAVVEIGLKWPDLKERYRTSSVLVVPSLSEGFPRVLYEGMSQSVPIVASGLPPIAAVLSDGVHALLCPPGDVKTLAPTIERLLANSELKASLAVNAFELVSNLLRANAERSHARQVSEIAL
jgi:glycosyltransferase involved in cell wall biosynthesis